MSNQIKATSRRLKRTDTPMTNETVRWTWYGYQDVKDGLDFRKQYEDCEEHIQRNYEIGRCYAIVLKREWGVIPEWPATITFTRSDAQVEALEDGEVRQALLDEQKFHFKDVRKV